MQVNELTKKIEEFKNIDISNIQAVYRKIIEFKEMIY